MKKLLIFVSFVTICAILLSGCGMIVNKPQHDMQEEAQTTVPVPLQISTAEAGNLQPGPQPGIAAPQPTLSVESTSKPSPSQPSAKETTVQSKHSRKPEPTKKPSVPVHQNQGKRKAAARSLTLTELVRKYPNILKLRGSSKEKKVALTFDDGPDSKFTPQVLDVLKLHHVKATFFLVGTKAGSHPELVQRIVREGHIIGNHSYNHAFYPKLSQENFVNQIESTQNVLKKLTGYAPKLIRPPYGAINEQQVKWLSSHNYLIVNWNVDSLDWKQLGKDKVLQTILQQTRPGSIILQHSGGGDKQDLSGTVEALPLVIQKLKADGYQLVTVPELLQVAKNL
ncbi:polysaccharide deacetylase family protein [Paenibacillus eucommiae]|uniref:Polysaccharide deacetylase family sporulation protein PdaB n=1 Tax=Paenibacillus eucommiae TaxID=1355755 RepID=A0ABS4IV04_9BACL|nr:polysaccharide deacetylase family protein [Paenibacillus eucommiae]MBP1991418.1 polysaccharide deacetylase family sporulation protein PdaB [Paenibacillus eucommiae]